MPASPDSTAAPGLATLELALAAHREAAGALLAAVGPAFARLVAAVRACLAEGGTVFCCGNGGSAADAQHFASELVGRTPPLRAAALTVDPSALTALANDHGYTEVFARQIRALGRPGDVLIALSTSGRSPNVVRAVQVARAQGLVTVALGGPAGGPLIEEADIALCAPGQGVPRIQEMHMLLLHALWEALEDRS